MSKFFKRFAADESGATAIEYGLIIALIAVVIAATVQIIGQRMDAKLTTASSYLQ